MKTSEDPILKGRWSFMAKMLAAIFFVQYAWEIMLDSEAFLQRWHLSQQKIPCLIIVRHTSTVLLDNHCNCAQLYVAFLRRNACIVERIHITQGSPWMPMSWCVAWLFTREGGLKTNCTVLLASSLDIEFPFYMRQKHPCIIVYIQYKKPTYASLCKTQAWWLLVTQRITSWGLALGMI